ncbi:hypothetical protein Tco_0690635 [Tanacetum coccineum]
MASIDPILKNHGFNSEIPILRIDHINTPYSHETQKQEETLNEHLYSASAIEIDEKRPELKDLPSHLEYAYLKGDESYLVIISSKLTEKEKTSLLWESFKSVIQSQRRLNLKVQDVVKDEIIRLLDLGLIYPISDSPWEDAVRRLSNAPATFQRCMTTIFHDMVEDFMEVFMDDFSVFGAENLAADHLSRLENPNIGELAKEEIEDKFPNEHLMILKTKLNDEEPWYADYVNYIIRKLIPPEWTPEKKKMVLLSNLTAAVKNHFMELNELMELRDGAYENTQIYKERTKKWHDSRLRGDKDFKNGDKVLLFNSRLKLHPGKLKSKWIGPFLIKTMYPYRAVEIIDKDGSSFKVNGHRLKKYHDRSFNTDDNEFIELDTYDE